MCTVYACTKPISEWGNMTDEIIALEPQGVPRRTVMKAAAWAVPVVAVAATAPLAAASVTNPQTQLGVASGSNLTLIGANEAGSTVTGTFGGSATVTNVGPGWDIDDMTVEYSLEGPIAGAPLTYLGQPLTGPTLTHAGYTWTINMNIDSYVYLTLLSPKPVNVPADDSVTVPVPVLEYAETLTGSAAWLPLGRRVRAAIAISVTSGGVTLNDSNVKSLPGSA